MTRIAPGDPGQFAPYQLHKALGVAAMLLAVARLAFTLVVPLSGRILASESRLDVPILLAWLGECPRIESPRAMSPEARSSSTSAPRPRATGAGTH